MALASRVLMVYPSAFGFNADTAESNTFQQPANIHNSCAKARSESAEFAKRLTAAGVEVVLDREAEDQQNPDSVFPNNWVSFHPGSRAILYPMLAPSRKREVRPELIASLGYQVVLDLREGHGGKVLEGTGSLVIDPAAAFVYASVSSRTDPALALTVANFLGLELVLMAATSQGTPIYHTNVLMAIGLKTAVICAESIENPGTVIDKLQASGKVILEITRDQMNSFAGNMLQLATSKGQNCWVMSERAWASLRDDQKAHLESEGGIVLAPIETIETLGGGSARCMIAELG